MWGNTVVIHIVLKKKTTKLNSQPVQYKKIKSTKTILEKNHKKIKKPRRETLWHPTDF